MTDQLMAEERIFSLPYELKLDAIEVRRTAQLDKMLVELYTQLRPSVFGYVYQIVGSTRDAEDLLQVALLRLCDALQSDIPIRNVRGWVYRVVHNLAIDQVRRLQTERSFEDTWIERTGQDASAEDVLIQRQEVTRALASLNDRERHCILLRADGLSYQEIGDVLSISAKAVSVYLARAVAKFARTRATDQ